MHSLHGEATLVLSKCYYCSYGSANEVNWAYVHHFIQFTNIIVRQNKVPFTTRRLKQGVKFLNYIEKAYGPHNEQGPVSKFDRKTDSP